jgi:putative oxidoreductase
LGYDPSAHDTGGPPDISMKKLFSLLQFNFIPCFPNLALLVLRLWIGLSMLLLHGWGKLMNFSEMSGKFADPFGIGSAPSLALAVFAEVVCSGLLVLGLFTRFAALNGVITLAVAFFMVHGGALKGANNGELAFLYLAGYVVLLLAGGGRLALDASPAKTDRPAAKK